MLRYLLWYGWLFSLYSSLLSQIGLYGNGVAECVAVVLGGRGLHATTLSPAQLAINYKTLFAAQLSWTLSTSAIKVALLLLYARVFPSKRFKIVVYIMIGVVTAYCLGCLITFFANCQPFEANFAPGMPGVHCGNPQAGWLGTGLANILTDIAILSLPMRNVWNLQLPKRTKWAVMGVFAIGFATVIISTIRLVSLFQIDVMDFTYTAVPADILSAFEPTLAIACTCIPIMRPLFKRFFPTHSRSNLYGGRGMGGQSGANHAQKSDIVMSGLKKNSVKQHKRISIPATSTDGFRRLEDEQQHKTTDWKTHFTSRSSTPVPLQVQDGKQQGIEITTDIVVQRD